MWDRLTLPRIECGGFFLHPEGLPPAITGQAVEVLCPEAFTRPKSRLFPCAPRYRSSSVSIGELAVRRVWRSVEGLYAAYR